MSTFGSFVLVQLVQAVKDGQDLHGAERVQQVRIVVRVAAEPACAAIGSAPTNSTGVRTVVLLAFEQPGNDLILGHLVARPQQVHRHQRPVHA